MRRELIKPVALRFELYIAAPYIVAIKVIPWLDIWISQKNCDSSHLCKHNSNFSRDSVDREKELKNGLFSPDEEICNQKARERWLWLLFSRSYHSSDGSQSHDNKSTTSSGNAERDIQKKFSFPCPNQSKSETTKIRDFWVTFGLIIKGFPEKVRC